MNPTIERPTPWVWWIEPAEIKTQDGNILLVGGATHEDGTDFASIVIVAPNGAIDAALTADEADDLTEQWSNAAQAVPQPGPQHDPWLGKVPTHGVWHLDADGYEPVDLYVRYEKVDGAVEVEFALFSADRCSSNTLSLAQTADFTAAFDGVREALRMSVDGAQ